MKKNKMMRIASVLLVLVLLSTSIISGTFAKYVTSGEVEDSARVAKFGVVVTGSGSLFDKTYYAATQNTPANGAEDTDNVTLTVEAAQNVVAPGTKNDDGLTLAVSGQPEVDVRVKYDLTINDEIFLKQGGAVSLPDLTKGVYTNDNGEMTSDSIFKFTGTYYPIRFTLAGDLVEKNLTAIKAALKGKLNVNYGADSITGTLADIETALGAINGNEGIYVDANTDLANVEANGIGSLQLTWEWPFDGTTVNRIVWAGSGIAMASAKQVDQMDTLLGDLAATDGKVAGVTDDMYSLNVNVALTVTVTQVD